MSREMSVEEKRKAILVSMVRDAKTTEQVNKVLDSEELREASALEVALASSILGVTMLRIRLESIENELAVLRIAVEAMGSKK